MPRNASPKSLMAEAVRAYRDDVRTSVSTSREQWASKYEDLLSTDVGAADKFLSRLLAQKGIGLPSAMPDPWDETNMILGGQVVTAAADYVVCRGADRTERLGRDPAVPRNLAKQAADAISKLTKELYDSKFRDFARWRT